MCFYFLHYFFPLPFTLYVMFYYITRSPKSSHRTPSAAVVGSMFVLYMFFKAKKTREGFMSLLAVCESLPRINGDGACQNECENRLCKLIKSKKVSFRWKLFHVQIHTLSHTARHSQHSWREQTWQKRKNFHLSTTTRNVECDEAAAARQHAESCDIAPSEFIIIITATTAAVRKKLHSKRYITLIKA